MNVVIINYGMGNLGSVRRALEECGGEVRIVSDPGNLGGADRIVLPGVGAFKDGMANLAIAGWPHALKEALENPRVALLGICLGMQMLADGGSEGGEAIGLGLIPGRIERMTVGAHERLPHIGWNEMHIVHASPLLTDIQDAADFYFVHSYRLVPLKKDDILGVTPYGSEFASAVQRKNVYGVQFHPEKSSRAGFQLLRNFLSRSVVDA